MSDIADESCVHIVRHLAHNAMLQRLEWLCSDCGRVFASINDWLLEEGDPIVLGRVSGIPERAMERWVRGRATA